MEIRMIPKASFFKAEDGSTFRFEGVALLYSKKQGYLEIDCYDNDMNFLYAEDVQTMMELNN